MSTTSQDHYEPQVTTYPQFPLHQELWLGIKDRVATPFIIGRFLCDHVFAAIEGTIEEHFNFSGHNSVQGIESHEQKIV